MPGAMNVKLWWRQTIAKWLLLAELDLQSAQRDLDGSDRARRRYQWALLQLRQAEEAAASLDRTSSMTLE